MAWQCRGTPLLGPDRSPQRLAPRNAAAPLTSLPHHPPPPPTPAGNWRVQAKDVDAFIRALDDGIFVERAAFTVGTALGLKDPLVTTGPAVGFDKELSGVRFASYRRVAVALGASPVLSQEDVKRRPELIAPALADLQAMHRCIIVHTAEQQANREVVAAQAMQSKCGGGV